MTRAELGVVPTPRPNQPQEGFYKATFCGGRMTCSLTFYFEEEPEDRAIQTLAAEFGAATVAVTVP